MSICHRIDELRDYALDELAPESRNSMEQHLAGCSDCAAELDRLRLTTAALRVLPDHEIPQRIAFVSDKIFEPSPARRWLEGFWNSGPGRGWALRRRACWRWR
jgi:anti-sigma factor RsiW